VYIFGFSRVTGSKKKARAKTAAALDEGIPNKKNYMWQAEKKRKKWGEREKRLENGPTPCIL